MDKIIRRIRGFATSLLLRLFHRTGLEGAVWRMIAEDPYLVRDKFSELLAKTSDKDLDQIMGDIEKGAFNGESLRMIETFRAAGVDMAQEVRNEKFLREHRRKHGQIPR